LGELVEHSAADDLGSHLRQEALVPGGEKLEEVIGSHGIEHGVAEELEAFVVDPDPAGCFLGGRAVQEGLLIKTDIARPVSEDASDRFFQLFVRSDPGAGRFCMSEPERRL